MRLNYTEWLDEWADRYEIRAAMYAARGLKQTAALCRRLATQLLWRLYARESAIRTTIANGVAVTFHGELACAA